MNGLALVALALVVFGAYDSYPIEKFKTNNDLRGVDNFYHCPTRCVRLTNVVRFGKSLFLFP